MGGQVSHPRPAVLDKDQVGVGEIECAGHPARTCRPKIAGTTHTANLHSRDSRQRPFRHTTCMDLDAGANPARLPRTDYFRHHLSASRSPVRLERQTEQGERP